MTWNPERQTINQRLQFGPEATTALGTSVAASKLVECFDLQFQINGDTNLYTPTGRKYANILEENTEWVDMTLGGNLDYNGVLYPLDSVMGSVSPVAHGSSATAKDWVYTPPVTGSVVPRTYTIEQGDAVRAHKTSYALFTEFGYKGTRKDFTCSGKGIAQPLTDGITMTSSPTAVALSPVVAKHVNVYLDSTSGGLGTTLLTRVLSVDFLFTGLYGPLWVLNRATTGWTAHVDLMPKATLKLKLEADANGMALLSYLQAGSTQFVRVSAQGVQIAADGPGAVNATIQHDMAVKINKPTGTFADDQGVFALEWELDIIEDQTWGKAQTLTVTNLITAL